MNVIKLVAPIAPFISEDFYQRLKSESEPVSIHLNDLPLADKSLIDPELERRMNLAQKITSLTRFLREKSNLKVRQPLRRILIPVVNPQFRRDIQKVENVIIEEINVKGIEYIDDESNSIIRKSARPNFKVIGKKFGKSTQDVANAIKNLKNDQIISLENSGKLAISMNDINYDILLEDIEIISEDIEGWLVASEDGITVALDTTLDDDLINEGIAREFISKIQNMRKDMDFEVLDKIEVKFNAEDKFKNAILNKSEYIKNEILAVSVTFEENPLNYNEIEINDKIIRLIVCRI